MSVKTIINTVSRNSFKDRGSFELTLPSGLRNKVLPGDFFRVESTRGRLVLRPVAVDPADAWFWSKEWQKKESEASQDTKQDRLSGPYRSASAFMASLKRRAK